MMRAVKRILGAAVLVCIIAVVVLLWWARDKHVTPILMYHNIEETDVRKANSVSPASFRFQMQYLKDKGFTVISLDTLVESIRMNQPLPRKAVVLTFDDAYEDNYTEAFPVLKEFGYPAIVFVPSDLVGTDGYVTWEQLKEMQAAGFVPGSHTRHHAYLPDVKEQRELRNEIELSKDVLEANMAVKVDYFSYPSGGFSEEIKDITRESGYRGAVATNRGYDKFNKDVYELNRIRVSDDDRSLDLWAKLSGYYNLFRSYKHPY